MFVCRGPDFLLRVYAKALAAVASGVRLRVYGKTMKGRTKPQVLHFGGSYIVADKFSAERNIQHAGSAAEFWVRADALRKSARKQRSESATLLRKTRRVR
jgi:hypothetical protein